jgi:UDP-glucose 4-epimerase
MSFLAHGRVLDCSRARDELDFVPEYSTPAAFDDFVRERGLLTVLSAERVAAAEQVVRSAATTLARATLSGETRG